ncbi:sialidase [Polaribacter sp. SA4-10]|uniref:sialidase n=1 Tax=Polaribacter sp. SA4-10 TaxID=754397 RepID=UPI000B582DCC|nr:sialidase [Polaribacter sp. SA4-10]ARV05379.1 sialidase [Polaribacter sp. SA4-10]
MKNFSVLVLVLLIISCAKKEIIVSEIPFEFGINNAEPNLVEQDGMLSLSWVNSIRGEKATLLYSQLENDTWKKPTTITSGADWFVNWADFPANATNGDVLLTSHLQKSASGTYTYDVVLNLRKLNGEIIKENFLLNTDGMKAEHGFVSIIPNLKEGFFVTWLDGRKTVMDMKVSHHKAMTIRTAEVSKEGTIFNETQVDGRTCDCCQTSITVTENGPLIVYRDRSNTEIRDIYYSEQINGIWNEPKPVFNDNWKINGCPVNGPKVVAKNKTIAVAWFTAAEGDPKVKIAFSTGAKANFKAPIILNDVDAIGRVDVAFINEEEVLVTYIETDETTTYLRCKKVSLSGETSKAFTISEIDSSRSTGVPQLEIIENVAYVVWTISVNKKQQIKSVKFQLEGI